MQCKCMKPSQKTILLYGKEFNFCGYHYCFYFHNNITNIIGRMRQLQECAICGDMINKYITIDMFDNIYSCDKIECIDMVTQFQQKPMILLDCNELVECNKTTHQPFKIIRSEGMIADCHYIKLSCSCIQCIDMDKCYATIRFTSNDSKILTKSGYLQTTFGIKNYSITNDIKKLIKNIF